MTGHDFVPCTLFLRTPIVGRLVADCVSQMHRGGSFGCALGGGRANIEDTPSTTFSIGVCVERALHPALGGCVLSLGRSECVSAECACELIRRNSALVVSLEFTKLKGFSKYYEY